MADIPFIRDFEPKYGALVRISKNVRRLVANNSGPFTAWGTNVYVVGKDEVFVFDPGPNLNAHFEVLLQSLGNEKVNGIFITHHHMDHSPLAARLAQHFGCLTYGIGAPEKPAAGQDIKLEAGEDYSFQPKVTIKDGQVFTGNGWSIEAVHTPGHTSNHVCYGVLGDNGLICGDHIMGWATSVVIPPDGDMDDYLRSLQKVQLRNYDVLWPGHGAPIDQPARFIRAYIDHRQKRNMQILQQLGKGQRRIKDIVPVIYADTDPGLYPAASISVLSHMIFLIKSGKVIGDGPPGLKTSYHLA